MELAQFLFLFVSVVVTGCGFVLVMTNISVDKGAAVLLILLGGLLYGKEKELTERFEKWF